MRSEEVISVVSKIVLYIHSSSRVIAVMLLHRIRTVQNIPRGPHQRPADEPDLGDGRAVCGSEVCLASKSCLGLPSTGAVLAVDTRLSDDFGFQPTQPMGEAFEDGDGDR